jgi:hypothetical protein
MTHAIEWLRTNPEYWAPIALGAWQALTALVSAALKPRSPEEYAALAQDWPRFAAGTKLLAALGFDAPKALDSLQQLIAGKARTIGQERRK